MLIKYDTRAEALSAVKKSGKNLELTTFALRDDEEIVRTALEHGGSIEHASFRLRNSPELLLVHARSGVIENVFERALFCARMDIALIDPYCRLFMRNREFNLELKLSQGARFRSSFSEYNSMSKNELLEELRHIRLNQIAFFRKVFKKTVIEKMYEIEESDDLRFSLVRIPALSLHYHHGSFSQVKESFATNMRLNQREKDYYCSERGSGSFPERFMKSLLDQLGIDYAREKVFDWSAGTGSNARMGQKRYDFYIPTTSTIIEVHGAQHYDGGFESLGGRTLAEEQENDLFKAELAKQNGIQHYIVVNAVSSDFKFLRNSVSTNADFTTCFNLSEIDWDAVYNGTIGKKETDQVFPYFDFCQSLYQTWYDLIESTETSADYKPVPRVYGTGYSDTQELLDNVATTFPSTHGLYPHELMVLRYAPKYVYPVDPDDYSAKVFYDNYGIGDVKPYFDKLIAEDFLCVSDTKTILQKSTVPTIRRFLADTGHAVKGRKDELIQYILDNIPEETINDAFPQKYYMLTDKGTSEVEESKYLTEGAHMGLSVWTMNRFVNAFPYERVHDLLMEFQDRPRRFYPYLTQKEKDALGPKYSQSSSEISNVNRTTVKSENRTVCPVKVENPIQASKPQIKSEISAPTVQNVYIDVKHAELQYSDTEINDTSEAVAPSPKPQGTVIEAQPVVYNVESTKNKNEYKVPSAQATKENGHVREILTSKEVEYILTKNASKSFKTRKIFIVLMIPFLFLTALAISMMLSDIHMLSVISFFGIPTAMFAVLSRSPKYCKYILGRDNGLKKGQFVLLCITAMIIAPILCTFLIQ